MLKIGLLIAAPSILTYLASTYFQSMESFFYIFVLSSAALLVAVARLALQPGAGANAGDVEISVAAHCILHAVVPHLCNSRYFDVV